MSLNWRLIQNVETKELTDDQAEVLYDQLTQYNLNGSESVEQLRMLFNCSKLVMQVKGIQADVAIEELEEIISKENSSKKTIETNIERTNQNAQRDQQILELERANESLRNQLKDKNSEINSLEQTKQNLEQNLKLNEKKLQNYNQEIEQLRDELHNEKEQINEQLANNNLPFEQLREMNKKFYMLLEEMKDMETMNTQLGQKVQKLNEELDSATQQIQTATKEMQYMRNQLKNLQEMNDLLINEKEEHLNEIKHLKSMNDSYELENDESSNSRKIEELIGKLEEKEKELNDLRSLVNQIDRKKIENEKSYFLKEISKRDNHIKLLRNQLSQAIDDIEAQTRVIENLIEKNIESIHKVDNQDSTIGPTEDNQILNSRQIINKLEDELKSKDKEMAVLHKRNTLYEKGIYGLSEAVEEIQKLKKLLNSKDNEIDKLIKDLNSINLKLSNTQDELDYLKEFLNADDDLKQKLNEDSEIKNDKLKILKLQKEVIRLDAEKLQLYEENLSFKLGNSGRTKINRIDQSDARASNNSSSDVKLVDNSDQEIEQLQKLNTIQELENENRELQLAMKEIMLSLKESDSKSDVIIDCPSLERLCQFFESRSINSNLANVIALKAELDILRGHNEELRMVNKRLRNDIFKIFENYSKQLLTDFLSKHNHPNGLNSNETKELDKLNNDFKLDSIQHQNHTLTEDELYDSDLSEGEIILSSRSLKDKKQNQESQTDLDYEFMNEFDFSKKKVDKEEKSSCTSDNESDKESLHKDHSKEEKEIDYKYIQTDQLDEPVDKVIETFKPNEEPIDKKTFNEQNIQTDLCLDDLKNVDYLKEFDKLNLRNVNELKRLIDTEANRSSESEDNSKESKKISKDFNDVSCQTEQSTNTNTTTCAQCSLVQNLLIEFQNKIDRIDSSIVQREDLYNERINVLQEENDRLQTELRKIVGIKDNLLNQKDKQLIELNDKIIRQKETIVSLEKKSSKSEDGKGNKKDDTSSDKNEEISKFDESKLDHQSIDNQLAIINRNTVDTNQKGLVNILETIVKCLQARIEHKDEAIAHYQQLLTKTQEEHQQEIQKIMKNYKKVTEHSIKAIQSSSNTSQEQLEMTLTKYNDQLNEFKVYHQKVLVEQKKALELQTSKLKKLKIENERLKAQGNSIEEMNRLRMENDQLNRLVEKNVKFIEKLKSAMKEENALKQDQTRYEQKQDDQSRSMQLNKLKEETEKMYKLLLSKDKQIKELQLSKWNLEKKINEIMQANKAELGAKAQELERMMNDQFKLKNLLEKLEKEKNALRRKNVVIKHQSDSSFKNCSNKAIQTDLEMNFNEDFVEKFKQLDGTIAVLKSQLQNCAYREKELINMLEIKTSKTELSRSKKESSTSRSVTQQSVKGKRIATKKNSNSCDF